jgi:hypothetical protein
VIVVNKNIYPKLLKKSSNFQQPGNLTSELLQLPYKFCFFQVHLPRHARWPLRLSGSLLKADRCWLVSEKWPRLQVLQIWPAALTH